MESVAAHAAKVLCRRREEGTLADGLQVRSPAAPVRFAARCSIPCIAAGGCGEPSLPPAATIRGRCNNTGTAAPGRGKCHLAQDAEAGVPPLVASTVKNAASAAGTTR